MYVLDRAMEKAIGCPSETNKGTISAVYAAASELQLDLSFLPLPMAARRVVCLQLGTI